MSRQTAFPGIWIESIGIEKPPFDESGVIQEFVGRGVTKEFELLQKAAEFSEENVEQFIQDAEDMIGPTRDSFRIKYNLKVRAAPTQEIGLPDAVVSFTNWLAERSVSARARTFARAKNPFEPDVIEVNEPQFNSTLSGDKIGDVYDVTVTVTK